MPAILVIKPDVMQNSLFLALTMVITTILNTNFAYPWRNGQAELAWVAWFLQRCNQQCTARL